MSEDSSRILVHFLDGNVKVRLVGAGTDPDLYVVIPAAVAIDENDRQFYFEEALELEHLKESLRFYSVVYDPREYGKGILEPFVEALFDREDVLEVVGNLEKHMVLCSSSKPYNGFRFRKQRGLFHTKISTRCYYLISEIHAYSFSSDERYDMVLNLETDYMSLFVPGRSGIFSVAPGFNDILNYFIKLLCLKGYDFTDAKGRTFCRQIVLKYCYVALDLNAEQEKLESKNGVFFVVETPDGDEIELGEECFLAPEILFQPALIGMEGRGVAEEIYLNRTRFRARGVQVVGPELNFLLCGILGKKPKGFSKRFEKEMTRLSEGSLSVKFAAIETLDFGVMNLPTSFFDPF